MDSIQAIVEYYAPQRRAGLLPALQAAQVLEGWLSPETMAAIATGLGVPVVDAYGVAKFYTMLYTKPTGRTHIRICDDIMCRMAGARHVMAAVVAQVGIRCGETTPDGATTIEAMACLGGCHRAPVVLVEDMLVEHADPAKLHEWIDGNGRRGRPRSAAQRGPHLLHEIGVSGLHRLPRARTHGRYEALRKALTLEPSAIIAEVKASGLLGRGGAAFPTGIKWEGAAREIAARGRGADGMAGYVVCDADESETGTFKDRILVERDPHRLIEAMLIAGRAIGAGRGYFYVRGEYLLGFRRLSDAVEEAREAGLVGENILGSGYSFNIELRSGAGAYICGEETALLESIEGNRCEPRVKPPYPITNGLFGLPTVVNNVETLANVPGIIMHGAAWYRQWGTQQSPGTRLVCLSGSVRRPGLYEVSMGLPLRELIFNRGGGMRKGRSLQAVLAGGAAGAFLTPQQIDVPLDFQSLTAAGATFGSGAMMVFDDTVTMWEVLQRVTQFFAHESCGKCFPCQLGTQRQMEMVERIGKGDVRRSDGATVRALGMTMRDASLCGLGQTASSALISAIDRGLVKVEAI
jgi:NADH-quinone oxidoreductase subunit F